MGIWYFLVHAYANTLGYIKSSVRMPSFSAGIPYHFIGKPPFGKCRRGREACYARVGLGSDISLTHCVVRR